MSPDEYQQAWQAHASRTRVTIDADVLAKHVQRSQRDFLAMVLLRDCREAGISILMIPVWFYLGYLFSPVWTWYLTVPALLWVGGFIIVDRIRHKQKPPEAGVPLLDSVRESLTQVEHQIWLLRNVVWWYLLPFAIPILVFFAHTSWKVSGDWLRTLGVTTMSSVLVLALYGFIYFVNQVAVRKQLEPRRQELLELLASLKDETTSEASDQYPIQMGEARATGSRRRVVVAGLCAVALLLIGIAGNVFLYRLGHPEKSPFTAVQWRDSQPEVRVGEEWFRLISLDDIPASQIVAFSQRTYGATWRKRFEEDLVELLTRMGRPPRDTVTLVVQSLTSSDTRTLENVPMTRANRRAIRDAAQAREHGQ